MKYIFFGMLDLKYFSYCVLFSIVEIYISLFIYYKDNNIFKEHNLLESSCFFLGYLLNFIPSWLSNKKSKAKEKPIINGKKEENSQSIKYKYIYNNYNYKFLSS